MINLPEYLQQATNNNRKSIVYSYNDRNFGVWLKQFVVDDCVTPMCWFEDEAADCLHNCLTDDEGIVEIGSDFTDLAKPMSYQIIKLRNEQYGILYYLRLQGFFADDCFEEINAFFYNEKTTNYRESIIMAKYLFDHNNDMTGWEKDPYDSGYIKGFLKNESENKEYDSLFPDHSLSKCRKLIDYVRKYN